MKMKETREIAIKKGWKSPKHISNFLDEYSFRRYCETSGKIEAIKGILELIDERLNHMIASNIIEDELLYLKARIQGEKIK